MRLVIKFNVAIDLGIEFIKLFRLPFTFGTLLSLEQWALGSHPIVLFRCLEVPPLTTH